LQGWCKFQESEDKTIALWNFWPTAASIIFRFSTGFSPTPISKMRIMIKGGVWKNTEDEILKAAVMKYGKNQWARISSLLVRKSAKQCKARWYEWLDPSIKKTEWTREEEEKLLHLAKLMPTQWRTIAPIVGRTAAQCLEHYEKLLDAAQDKGDMDPNDDPRRLRPGEIDPNPETKPARPDPVDMDEDEKEMLSEARARLANTKGKKAKRKAREKQLEEARRLAALQKRRELKAAGIGLPNRKRKTHMLDLNLEIPFEKKPPPGFFATDGEIVPVADVNFVNVTLDRLEGKRRDDEETKNRKLDAKKQKIRADFDLPAQLVQINKMNDPEQLRKRTKLALPAPQISDRELEEIVKLGSSGQLISEDGSSGAGPSGSRSGATKALLSNYGSATPTPLFATRTPRTPAGGDTILMEAQNLVALTNSVTPLMGGENTPLHPSSFEGATPKRMDIQTPNPLATPLRTPSGMLALPAPGSGSTPGRGPGGTPSRATPLRDELKINDSMSAIDEAALSEKRRMAMLRKQLAEGLDRLPAPTNEYEVAYVAPKEKEEDDLEAAKAEEDASDALARAEREKAQREEAALKQRSQALQRNLPRPVNINRSILRDGPSIDSLPPLQQADELIKSEMLVLLDYDAAKFPLSQRPSKTNGQFPDLEYFSPDELQKASEVLETEAELVRLSLGHKDDSGAGSAFEKAWEETEAELVYLPSQQKFGRAATSSKQDRIDGLRQQWENLRAMMEREAKRAMKLEQKMQVLLGGYEKRSDSLAKQMDDARNSWIQTSIEDEVFRQLHINEQQAAPARAQRLKDEIKKQMEREGQLQQKYAFLLSQREELTTQPPAPSPAPAQAPFPVSASAPVPVPVPVQVSSAVPVSPPPPIPSVTSSQVPSDPELGKEALP